MLAGSALRLLCAALAALALAVAGCGGGSEDPEPEAALTKAFSPEGIGELKSGNLDVEMTLGVSNGGDPAQEVKLSLSGPFDEGSTDLTASASGEDPSTGQPIAFEGGLTVTPDNLYIAYGGTEYELGAQRFAQLQAAQPAASATPGDFKENCRQALEQSGGEPAVCDQIQPREWVPKLSFDGTEDVGGTETDHFSGELDVERFFSDLLDIGLQSVPSAQRAQVPRDLLEQAAGFIEEAGVDAYVGTEDDIPRRGEFTLKLNALGTEVDLGFDAELTDANQPQTIAAPTGAQPIETLRSELPSEFRGTFDCFLGANTAAELTACSTQLGGASVGLPAAGAAL